jgi:hypothetical protein
MVPCPTVLNRGSLCFFRGGRGGRIKPQWGTCWVFCWLGLVLRFDLGQLVPQSKPFLLNRSLVRTAACHGAGRGVRSGGGTGEREAGYWHRLCVGLLGGRLGVG